jgi:putative Holliday junction resolvase
MKVIGVDYGGKFVGIAVSDDGGTIAFPHTVTDPRNALEVIVGLVAKDNAVAVVVGESLDQSGQKNTIARKAEAFAETLRGRIPIPIHFEQEGFTTMHARQPLTTRRGTVSRPRPSQTPLEGRVDASAAALILQRYLDRTRHLKTIN